LPRHRWRGHSTSQDVRVRIPGREEAVSAPWWIRDPADITSIQYVGLIRQMPRFLRPAVCLCHCPREYLLVLELRSCQYRCHHRLQCSLPGLPLRVLWCRGFRPVRISRTQQTTQRHHGCLLRTATPIISSRSKSQIRPSICSCSWSSCCVPLCPFHS
jgi:hypothetical protein